MSLPFQKLYIILPTYNESSNLKILLTSILKLSPLIHVLVVDDSSANEKKKIKRIAKNFKHVDIISREKKSGRGSAVLVGFTEALHNKNAKYFIEMDTDLAHDPSQIPAFYNKIIKEDASVVVGSRYIANSKIIKWPMRRLIISKIINAFLNIWLGLQLHDYTNGYRMYDRSSIEYLVKNGLREKDFIALSESAYKLKKAGYKIVEVPILFTDRKHGHSSVGTKGLLQNLIGALRIRFY